MGDQDKVGKDQVVSIEYTLTDDDGKTLDTSVGGEPLSYLHGHGQIVPGLEKELEGKVVACPAHGSAFDVTTGRNLEWVEGLPGLIKRVTEALVKPKDLNTFPVKVEEGQVWIGLEAGS